MTKRIGLSILVFAFVAMNLTLIQLKVETTMLLLDRLFEGGGFVEIFLVSFFGALLMYKMYDAKQSAYWRRLSWSMFSIWFFTQLVLGLLVSDEFLLTGKLHLPVPAMMISGPIFRGQKSIMTIMFLSTIILTGPAWCSQFCYFGAVDSMISWKKKPEQGKVKHKTPIKFTLLFLVIFATILLRLLNVSPIIATILGATFGVVGMLIIIFISRKKGKMVHCSVYCPIGTVVNYLRFANPFRMRIDQNCTSCMKCTAYCKYDALNFEDIKNKKPGINCTLCGDCINACHTNSIHYKFLKMKPEHARNLYLFLTISVYCLCLAVGRI